MTAVQQKNVVEVDALSSRWGRGSPIVEEVAEAIETRAANDQ